MEQVAQRVGKSSSLKVINTQLDVALSSLLYLALSRALELDDLQRCLPTLVILSDSVIWWLRNLEQFSLLCYSKIITLHSMKVQISYLASLPGDLC